MRERNEELKEKILNGETEESVAIGAGSYTKSEWSKFLKDFDDAQDMIKQQIREEITKRVEKQEKIEEIEDEKFEKDIDKDIIEGLRANFVGECTEVGMYLAMARQADREGYPEVAEAYTRIAYEEAEHAAKFAEMLGEVVMPDTKSNLSARVEAEFGACSGKKELAGLAKKHNLDAIHDTVHEMCKDEARHGRAFKGLLDRYFTK